MCKIRNHKNYAVELWSKITEETTEARSLKKLGDNRRIGACDSIAAKTIEW